LRHDAVGYNSKVVATPNIDKLAESGTIFTNCYAQSPQCHPSRVSLFTSRYPTAHKSWWNECGLQHGETLFSSELASIGYNCGYFGKAHFANSVALDNQILKSNGFNTAFTYADWLDVVSPSARKEFTSIMRKRPWIGRLSDRKSQHEDIITDEAIKFINEVKSPYLAVVSYYGPHPPYAAPPPFNAMYDPAKITASNNSKYSADQWKDLKSQYFGCISWIDDNIGRLLQSVSDDTIIVFTSDHGDALGDFGHFSKGMFMYDSVTKVPLIIRSKRIDCNKYSDNMEHIDIVPTLLNSIGVAKPYRMQGLELNTPITAGSSVKRSVISMLGLGGPAPRMRMVKIGHYKYWVSDREEILFDLKSDPNEQEPIKNDKLLSRMRYEMIQALIRAEDPMPVSTNRDVTPPLAL
jgi:arylsulfatase A-like enzyme